MTKADDIRAYYNRPEKDAVLLGSMIMAHRKATGVTQQALSRQTGINGSTLHHFEGLLRLPPDIQAVVKMGQRHGAGRNSPGELTFKEARAIADLDSHELMRKHAKPFISGELASGDVERYVRIVRQHPEMEPEKVIAHMTSQPSPSAPTGSSSSYRFDPGKAVPAPPAVDPVVMPQHIRQASVNMRALLMVCRWDLTVDAMYACRELERLQAEITRALEHEKAGALA